MMTKNIAKVLLLVVLAAGTSFMYFFSSTSNDDLEKFNPTRVEYMVKDAKLYGTNTEGNFLYKIVAEKAEANNTDRQIYLDRVFLSYYDSQNISWSIASDKGKLLSNSNVLALSGNVTVQSLSSENDIETISTDYLEINPNTYTVATNRNVLAEYENYTLEAKGFTGLLKDNKFNFHSNINASIHP